MSGESQELPSPVSQEIAGELGKESAERRRGLNRLFNTIADKAGTRYTAFTRETRDKVISDHPEWTEQQQKDFEATHQFAWMVGGAELKVIRDLLVVAAKATGGRRPAPESQSPSPSEQTK